MPQISVILPTCNRAPTVAEAVQSVLAQTWTDFEVVVVDDGSTDDTEGRISRLEDPRIRIIRQERSERCVARNRGIHASWGEYVSFLDDDDRYAPRKLEQQLLFLRAHPEVDFVGSGFFAGEGFRVVQQPWRHGDGKDDITLQDCLYGIRPAMWTCLVRRTALDKMDHWFDTRLIPIEDIDFVLRLALACGSRGKWLRECVYFYTRDIYRNAQVILSAHHDWQNVLDKLYARPDLPADVIAQHARVYLWQDVHIACTAYMAGMTDLARFVLMKSLALRPELMEAGPELVAEFLTRLTLSNPEQKAACQRAAEVIFDHLPPLLSRCWAHGRAQALARIGP